MSVTRWARSRKTPTSPGSFCDATSGVGVGPAEMLVDEAILIKCYDSAEDGRARFTAHSAFDDPTAPAEILPRESIELRTLVFHTA
jgi:hypothetical protein